MSILGSCGKCGQPWAVHHQRKVPGGFEPACPAPADADAREIDRRLEGALIAAARSALGMPGTVDTFKPWLEAAGLDLVLVPARRRC
jgi:hypothetical protein